MICSKCGTVSSSRAVFCDNCGRRLISTGDLVSAQLVRCQACGAPMPPGAMFCDNCGSKRVNSGVLCPSCDQRNLPGSAFCDNCGLDLGSVGILCPSCGHRNLPGSAFCDNCGYDLGSVGILCPSCGQRNIPGSAFCDNCGYDLRTITTRYWPPAAPSSAQIATSIQRIPNVGAAELSKNEILQNRYEVLKVVARGGQGIVYQAIDNRLQRGVAIKELHAQGLSPEDHAAARASFTKEASMLAKLNHPNLPTIIDFFSQGEREYLVMEYIEGRTLRDLLEQAPHPLSEDDVVDWALQLCSVLAYLHSQQPPVIFRDLKPENVMLTEEGRVKLVDFSLARIFRVGKVTDTQPMGTAGFAPPEQFGKGQTDERSDLYSLGVTLHSLLTKHDPAQLPFVFPRATQLNPKVSGAMEQVLIKATQVNRNNRYQSAHEMNAAILDTRLLVDRHPDWSTWEGIIEEALLRNRGIKLTQLEEIPENRRKQAVLTYKTSHADLDLWYADDLTSLGARSFREWQGLLASWQNTRAALIREGQPSFLQKRRYGKHSADAIDDYVKLLASLLGISYRLVDISSELFRFYDWDVTSLFADVRVNSPLSLVALRRDTLSEADLSQLRLLLGPKQKGNSRIVLMLLFAHDSELPGVRRLLHQKMKAVYAYDAMILDRRELFQIVAAKDRQRNFRKFILGQVDLTQISPFVTFGPTSGDNFFGREHELQTIVEHAGTSSFLVIGGRRIGKSSLLHRLHLLRLPSAGFLSLYFDCSRITSYQTFMDSTPQNWQPAPPSGGVNTMGELLVTAQTDRPFVLLLDEADKLIQNDGTSVSSKWSIFQLLRAFANSGFGQLVLAGERRLLQGLEDTDSPLFNLAQEISLGPLDDRSVEELVTRSFGQLEIILENEQEVVRQITGFSAGHPNVVQRLCNRLIVRLNERESRRLTTQDVSSVVGDVEFQTRDFLTTFWEAATPLEKLITLVMSVDARVHSLRSIRDALDKKCDLRPSARQIDDALQRLVRLRAILKRSSDGYEFAVKAFPQVVTATVTSEDMIEVLTEEFQERGE